MNTSKRSVVIVGNGMVGQRLVERLLAGPAGDDVAITVVGEESRLAYDRVGLSRVFDGASEDDLNLASAEIVGDPRTNYLTGERVDAIDPDNKTATLSGGETLDYDDLVLATGSYAFVPPIPGHETPGCFAYRTLDDLAQIKSWAAESSRKTGVVIGGGLLGLEAAKSLQSLGLKVHVLEMAPNLMPLQLGPEGGAMLGRWITELDVELHCGVSTTSIDGEEAVTSVSLAGGDVIDCEIVVFSAGIRPRDELARDASLDVGERGGVVVNNSLQTSDPNIYAVGEVACHDTKCYGLVAPGYEMAQVLAASLAGDPEASFEGTDLSAKLKLLGVDVASFGTTVASNDTEETVYSDPTAKIYRRLLSDKSTGALLGGSFVGDVSGYDILRAMSIGDVPLDPNLAPHVLPSGLAPVSDVGIPDSMQICSCNSVTGGDLRKAFANGCRTTKELGAETGCGMSCGGCLPSVVTWLNTELANAGEEVSSEMCEHFAYSRQELYDLVRVHDLHSWSEVVAAHGNGLGCEICRPTVGSILASLKPIYVLDEGSASVQDTNDHSLANMQRNGTYSVVPRIPGGEVTPEQLIEIGKIAQDFNLYTKITGGQRIDMFGAKLGELPLIWKRVLDAGMESGHAYGKALRTVKSCVGDTWCRYGVQDSVSMAILLEKRYRGLRSPHKFKMAVSGCTRECAEAQSKDVGVIATENGWNLYVGGNGGRVPRHAELLASDLSDDALISAIDRFVMFYIRTADRMQRTSTWVDGLEGGIEHIHEVVIDDSLDIGAELEADVEMHVAGYQCEWEATLEDPDRLAHFVEFVNEPETSSQPVWIEKRKQRVPV